MGSEKNIAVEVDEISTLKSEQGSQEEAIATTGFIQRMVNWVISPLRNASSHTPPPTSAVSRIFNDAPPGTLIHITGLDGPGKTTLLYNHIAPRPDMVKNFRHMLALNIEQVRAGPVEFRAFDTGGCRQDFYKRMDEYMYHQADGVVYMVEAGGTGRDRILEAREELMLHGFYSDDYGIGDTVPVLILATKLDEEGARRPDQLETFFIENMSTSIGKRPCHLAGIDPKTGAGVMEAFQWLNNAMMKSLSTNERRKKDNKYAALVTPPA